MEPIEARPLGHNVDDKTIELITRAFWRRVYQYRHLYQEELPAQLPVEFSSAMATALLWLREPKPEHRKLSHLYDDNATDYRCNVLNCGGGHCVHALTMERCPDCGARLVHVTTTGSKFCSDGWCDYENPLAECVKND